MKSHNKRPRPFATLASHLAASAFMSLTSIQLALAAESDPLVPRGHMPRGLDIGATDCSLGDSATSVSSCQNDIRSAGRQLAAWSNHHEEDVSRGVTDGYLRIRMHLNKQIQNDRSVIRVLLARLGKAGPVGTGLEPQAAEIHKANQVWGGVKRWQREQWQQNEAAFGFRQFDHLKGDPRGMPSDLAHARTTDISNCDTTQKGKK